MPRFAERSVRECQAAADRVTRPSFFMTQPSNSALLCLFSGLGLAVSGCSLLQNADSLSSGYHGPIALGGTSAGGASVGASGETSSSGTASTGGAGDGASGSTASAGDSGASGQPASGGESGTGVGGAGGSAAVCVPSSSDTSCDGLDQNCKATIQDSACPAGCQGITVLGTSYMGCEAATSFSDAEILCQMQGMHLVRIDSKSENTIVVQIAQGLGSYVWIGGSDLALNGTFAWQDGTAFYANGAPLPGVYQNFTGTMSTGHCVQIHDDSAGPWMTAPCTDTDQFICKRY
jgi:hypothetical protein